MRVTQRLRALDNRVLKIDAKEAELRTEVGWRKMAGRWPWMAGGAGGFLLAGSIAASFGSGGFSGFGVAALALAFHSGQLKAEDDRLNGRGFMNRKRPPGV
jgi:hypothetical protein